MTDYLHHIPGRIRVRTASLRQNPARAAELKAALERRPGVRSVEWRPLTGSLLILYDAAAADSAALLALLPTTRALPAAPTAHRHSQLGDAVAKAVITFAVKTAVEHSLTALASALL